MPPAVTAALDVTALTPEEWAEIDPRLAVLPVPQHPNLRVLQTASASEFYVLDLQTRTAAPLVTSTSSLAFSMSPAGDQVWTFTPGGQLVVATGVADTHPRSLLIERSVRHG